jgi:competence protein ComEC
MTHRAQNQLLICRPQNIFSFALGIAGLQLFANLPHIAFSIFLLPLMVFICWRYSRLASISAFCIGFLFCNLVAHYALSQRLSLQDSGRTGFVVAKIVGLPEQNMDQWNFQAKIVDSDDFPMLVGQKIKLAWYKSEAPILPGEIWRFQVLLRTPNGVLNPGGFDSEQRSLQQRIAAQGYVKKYAERMSSSQGIDSIRTALSEQIRLTLDADNARFVQALALGDTRALTDQDWDILRKTGITHLIAISGFHVGIVAIFVVFFIRCMYWLSPTLGLWVSRVYASAYLSILAAWAYTALAGFAIPTVRTALMISVFMGGKLLNRNCSTIQAVALSLLAILLWDPFAILSPGFWLSFMGVLLLVAFMPQTAQQPVIKPFIRAQWLVSIGLLPLSIGFFHQTTLIGPLINLLAIPWISLVVVPLALLGILFSWLPVVASFFWHASALTMQGFWALLVWASQLQWSSIYSAEPSAWVVVLALLGACLCVLPRAMPCKWLGFVLLLPILIPIQDEIPSGRLRIAMIDVGQGLSILIRTKNHTLLYDAGAGKDKGFSRGESSIVPALRALQINQLDKVVISHADNDHAGGLSAIQANIDIIALQASYPLSKATACKQGDSWQWDGVRFSYLWPEYKVEQSDNDGSCVLQINAQGRTVLLTGDISANAEYQLVERYGEALKSDILLVPHHGSKTSSSLEFLSYVKPRLALVSSGFQNRFKHPNHLIVERYQDVGASLVNSVDSGWAELQSGSDGWHWRYRARIDGRHYWQRENLQQAQIGSVSIK